MTGELWTVAMVSATKAAGKFVLYFCTSLQKYHPVIRSWTWVKELVSHFNIGTVIKRIWYDMIEYGRYDRQYDRSEFEHRRQKRQWLRHKTGIWWPWWGQITGQLELILVRGLL